MPRYRLLAEVVEHERGYRAACARIMSLDGIIGGPADTLEKLRWIYGV